MGVVLIARGDGGVAERSSKAGCLAITAAIAEFFLSGLKYC